MDEFRIGICYIATGKYQRYLETFLENINKFCPVIQKRIVVFTDIENSKLPERKDVDYINIVNHPWPIITLLKFKRIKQCLDFLNQVGFNPTHIVNLDATVIPNRVINSDEFLFNDKIGVINHFLWKQLTREELNDVFWCDWDNSVAWRDSRKINFQAFPGFLSCPSSIVSLMCQEVSEMLSIDLKKGVIPYYHDESYYNKFLDNHPELIELINDQVWEDDDPQYCQYNKDAMWRVVSYEGLQEEKKV